MVNDEKASRKKVHVWKSTEEEKFMYSGSITPEKGTFIVEIEPFSIYSITTTTGQRKGNFEPPPSCHLGLPYYETFDEYANGSQPRYFCDQGGAFEICENGFRGKGLSQVITRDIRPIDWVYRKTPDPYTIFGDIDWSNYSVSCWVNLEGQNVATAYAMVGGRVIDSPCNENPPVGYYLKIHGNGFWELKRYTTTLIKGTIENFDATKWHHVKISFKDSKIEVFLDNAKLCDYFDEIGGISSGLVVLGSGYHKVRFDEISVEPLEDFTPAYARKIDDRDPSIRYIGKWNHIFASYSDYRRTLSETPGNGFSYFEYTFEGAGINIIGNIVNNRIKADIFLDGVKVRSINVDDIENGPKKNCSVESPICHLENIQSNLFCILL
ncbi:hypothetical protein [Thermotoga sp. RQ7]|uniref:hypothetical protein n=1 Tax=Thermotoga sp. RQ7 TaxID=126738 RepID=UPI00143C173C|nr:hypothetical protein [Thermotoga sp. RQ7]